jgi:hypothetical protein
MDPSISGESNKNARTKTHLIFCRGSRTDATTHVASASRHAKNPDSLGKSCDAKHLATAWLAIGVLVVHVAWYKKIVTERIMPCLPDALETVGGTG